jgi:hypothetical protein
MPETEQEWLDATRGLSSFQTEQVFAMSMRKEGVDGDELWQLKRKTVNQTDGLQFKLSAHPNFREDLAGVDFIRQFFDRMMAGPKRPGVIVVLDEAEKAFAGSSSEHGDSSGVSQDGLLSWLTWMENGGHDGLIAVGMPGTGKTATGMAIGPTYGIPTIVLDMGAMKGSHVGESQRKIREAFKVVDSIAGEGGAYVFATCNSEASLPPELKRRFKDGRWFFDLPGEEEKAAIWPIHLLANDTGSTQRPVRPDDTNWTGAEIRNCCALASRLGITLKEAAAYIVPIATSDPRTVERLREAARGRWLSVSRGGAYTGAVQELEARSVELN